MYLYHLQVSVMYLAEIVHKDIRGMVSMVTRYMLNFGAFLIMAIGPFVSYNTLNYMLLVLPILYFVACWCIPETPYYYLKEGNVNAARKVLQRLRDYKDETVRKHFQVIIANIINLRIDNLRACGREVAAD